ncbi:MAG: ROK family protein [Clostridia bacterium]|nr:ROK family protein [Clostridia bacterium]
MYYLGVDLGGTNIAIGLVDENFKIVLKDKVPTGASRPTSDIMDDMAALCKSIVERAGITFDDVEYAGIATPGSVDPETGYVRYANNIKMENYPIADELKKRTPLKKVLLENDANAAALAEAKAGAGKGYSDLVMITLGTGVGGGIVIGGKLYSGFNYCGAELGHTVIEFGGRPCTCGRLGCFEAYSSATGLINMTKEKMIEYADSLMWELVDNNLNNVSGRTAFDASKKGDKAAKEVVDLYIKYLACGLTNMVNIFQPQVLCIGGGVCGEGDYLLKPLIQTIRRCEYGAATQTNFSQIKIAELGNDAGIIGAAVLGL